MDSSSSQGGVDTLARIRVKATRCGAKKRNCTRPGMDVNSIPKKDCWQQVETFLWPPEKEMRAGSSSAEGSRIGGGGLCMHLRTSAAYKFHQTNWNRSHHSSRSCVKAVSRGATLT
ncbi:hypothetical protein KSP39_PZI005882 [Platanthera zijinensis]|uniref:Uncharacterized protein n=1 Tax=Platanthera zijinensis TaxID=2320716 RepID=A0AAP0GAU7_9ASPA